MNARWATWALLGGLAGCAAPITPAATSKVTAAATDAREVTDGDLVVRWQEGAATDAEVAAVRARGGQALTKLRALLGARAPNGLVVVELAGDGGPGDIPRVDPATGHVVLVRVQGPGGAYEASLPHELVHALRWRLWTDPAKQTSTFLFVEEALAELLAVEIGEPSTGFPTYGFPISVVAGAWLEAGNDLPMAALVRRHIPLNFQCLGQAYGQRLSFATWLKQQRGLEPWLTLGFDEQPLTPERFEQVFGGSLDDLAGRWRAWAQQELGAVPDAPAQLAAYRASPIRYLPVCDATAAAR